MQDRGGWYAREMPISLIMVVTWGGLSLEWSSPTQAKETGIMATALTFFVAEDMQEAISLANPRNGLAYTQAFTDACEGAAHIAMRGNNAIKSVLYFQPCGELPDHPGHLIVEVDKKAADKLASLPYGESEYHHGLAIKGA